MAHIEDRWYRVVEGANGRTERVKTNLFGRGMRYRVRYIGPDGRERSKSFPDRHKKAAEDFLVTIESDKLRGSYVDPAAGRITFGEYANRWLRTAAMDESTREGVESRVRNHLLPFFGARELGSIKPAHLREWDKSLAARYSVDTRAVSFAVLRAILSAAVDDERIAKNPCAAKSVTAPRQERRRIVPWKLDQVTAVRLGLPDRYRCTVDVSAGCGLRQGEVFGLAVDDLDFAGGWLHVQRQVKRVRSRLVFGAPKNDRDRHVPLPVSVAEALASHMAAFPPIAVELPWEDPTSARMVRVKLVFTSERENAIVRGTFNQRHWSRGLERAGIAPGRENGMHALRHFYASALLDAGESIKAVSEYLGHADPAFTLRVYTHLMPGSASRARRAIDGLFRGEDARRPGDGLAGEG